MQFVLQQGRAVNLMVEHHLEYDALVGLAKKLGQQGWVLWATAAALSGRSAKGTSGGALVITKATLAVTSFDGNRILRPGEAGFGFGLDWLAVRWQLKGTAVALVVVYFTDSLGMKRH